jgi:hypothetical protein
VLVLVLVLVLPWTGALPPWLSVEILSRLFDSDLDVAEVLMTTEGICEACTAGLLLLCAAAAGT